MPQYCLVYIGGGKPATPEEGQKHMSKYMEWIASLGDAAVSPANPFKGTTTVESDGSIVEGGRSTMSGYTIIDVPDMEQALSIAQKCPFLDMGGTLEVSELMKMPGQK